MTQSQSPDTRKASPAMFELLLAAVKNNGYLFASLHSGRTRRTFLASQDRGWISGDGRITFAGRNAAHRYDADAYAAALPADHVDFELNRLATGRMPQAPIVDRFAGQAHVLAIPDTFIQYDVPPGRAGSFVGYSINTRHGLRMIVHVEYVYDRNEWVDGARIFLSDGKGGVQYTGTVYSEFQAYGPAGGPDLRQNSADLLDRTRRAHDEFTAAAAAAKPTVLVEHTNPDTEYAETLVLADDVAAITESSAAETGARYQALMAAGDSLPVRVTPRHYTPEQISQMLHQTWDDIFRRHTARSGKSNLIGQILAEYDGPIAGTTGAGKTEVTFYPEEANQAAIATHERNQPAGKSYERMLQLLSASRDDRIHIIDPKTGAGVTPWQSFSRADLEQLTSMEPAPVELFNYAGKASRGVTGSMSPATLARMEATRATLAPASMNRRTADRLAPAVDPGQLRPQVEQLRDAIVAIVGDVDGIAGDVTAPGYRIHLHTARISTTSERARDALMKLETALSEIERGAVHIARVILTRAGRRLARR